VGALASTLPVLGCGGEVQPPLDTQDVQQVTGNVGTMAAPPGAATTIAFQTFEDDIGTRGSTETRTLIRSARGYQDFFGHAPPPAVDFSHEWVMFYGAGLKPIADDASFLSLLRSGRSLIAITQLIAPGAGCVSVQAVGTPHALIKFPAQAGTTAQFFRQDGTRDCGPQLCAAVQCPAGSDCDPATGKCHAACPPVCEIFCDNGNVLDANGCATCKCNPPPTDPCATVKCAAGTHCDSGKCLADGVTCGGIAGKPCPGVGKCVDNPNDSCDPQTGGADCGGICTCVQNVACTADSKFDSSPSVCACVPIKPPVCGPVCQIYCEYGNVLDANGCPTCKCNPAPIDLCATVKCAAGTHCDTGKCVADSVSCGGFAGKACPGIGKCVDDPKDSCDPKAGGADCIGICSCVQNVLCTADSRFDGSPSVCACVHL